MDMVAHDALMPIEHKALRSLRGSSMQGRNNSMLQGGFTASQLSSNAASPSPADTTKLTAAHGSYKFGPRCQTTSTFWQAPVA